MASLTACAHDGVVFPLTGEWTESRFDVAPGDCVSAQLTLTATRAFAYEDAHVAVTQPVTGLKITGIALGPGRFDADEARTVAVSACAVTQAPTLVSLVIVATSGHDHLIGDEYVLAMNLVDDRAKPTGESTNSDGDGVVVYGGCGEDCE